MSVWTKGCPSAYCSVLLLLLLGYSYKRSGILIYFTETALFETDFSTSINVALPEAILNKSVVHLDLKIFNIPMLFRQLASWPQVCFFNFWLEDRTMNRFICWKTSSGQCQPKFVSWTWCESKFWFWRHFKQDDWSWRIKIIPDSNISIQLKGISILSRWVTSSFVSHQTFSNYVFYITVIKSISISFWDWGCVLRKLHEINFLLK